MTASIACARPPLRSTTPSSWERPSVYSHAEASNDDVADLVDAVVPGKAPIDLDRLSRRAASRPANDFARDERAIRIGPATGHLGDVAAVGEFRQAVTIGE